MPKEEFIYKFLIKLHDETRNQIKWDEVKRNKDASLSGHLCYI